MLKRRSKWFLLDIDGKEKPVSIQRLKPEYDLSLDEDQEPTKGEKTKTIVSIPTFSPLAHNTLPFSNEPLESTPGPSQKKKNVHFDLPRATRKRRPPSRFGDFVRY